MQEEIIDDVEYFRKNLLTPLKFPKLVPPTKPDDGASKSAWKKYYWKRRRYEFKKTRDEEIKSFLHSRATRPLQKPVCRGAKRHCEEMPSRYEFALANWLRKMIACGYEVSDV